MCKVVVAQICSQNLENRNIPKSFKHWKFLQRLKLWLLLLDLKKLKPCTLYILKSLTFTNVFVFLINFSTLGKSCVKEQGPKKSLFQICWLNFRICYLRPKRGWNIFESLKSWQMNESSTDKWSWICSNFFGEQIKDLSSNQSKLTFWNQLHPKLAFVCRFDINGFLMTKPSNFDIKCQGNSESYDQHGFLGQS